jgi:hypothetical protein
MHRARLLTVMALAAFALSCSGPAGPSAIHVCEGAPVPGEVSYWVECEDYPAADTPVERFFTNDTADVVHYYTSCPVFSGERLLDDGTWEPQETGIVCGLNGGAWHPVEPGETRTMRWIGPSFEPADPRGPGTYRYRLRVGHGCVWSVGPVEARDDDCDSVEVLSTASFEVVP